MLTTDALSPIGRVAERHRDAFAEVVDEAAMAQTAATFQFTWPREGAARVAGRQLGRELLSRWTEKDAVRNRPAVTQWVEARWQELGLVPETLADRIHQYVTEGLGRAAVEQVERLIAPLVNNGPANVDIDSLNGLLDRICHIMGPPDPSYTKVDVGRAPNMFEKARSEFSKNYDKQVADLAIQAVELAGMRVAGSEEAMRQIGEKAKQALNSYESLAESLSNEVSESSRKLMQMIVNFDRQAPSGKRRDDVVIEMLQLFREYPKKQYQSMLAAELREIYRGIAGSIPEFMHEMNLCRNRPAETAKELERRIQEDGNLHATNSASRTLLPGGDESLTAFAKRIVLELTDAELLEADELAQAQIVDRFQGFLNFCLASGPKAEHLADVLERTGTDFFLKRLPNLHPADLLPSHKLDGEMKQALRHCI